MKRQEKGKLTSILATGQTEQRHGKRMLTLLGIRLYFSLCIDWIQNSLFLQRKKSPFSYLGFSFCFKVPIHVNFYFISKYQQTRF